MPVPLLYPPNSTAVPVPPGLVPDELRRFPCWLLCGGMPDALWAPGSGPDAAAGPDTRRGSFDDYAAHLVGPFAWLVLAWPVPSDRLAEERAALARSIPALRTRENDQGARIELERAELRHRELTRGMSSGMWDVEILVGGMSPADASSLAALLCSSSELDRLPYLLAPVGPVATFTDALSTAPDERSPAFVPAVPPMPGRGVPPRPDLDFRLDRGVTRTLHARGARCTTPSGLFDEISAVLQFPTFFGGGWDALHDSLYDFRIAADSLVLIFSDAAQILEEAGPEDLTIFFEELLERCGQLHQPKSGEITVTALLCDADPNYQPPSPAASS